MIRRIELMISIMLFFGASGLCCAQSHLRTLVIENVGVADHLIIPMVISNSDAGIASGRQIVILSDGKIVQAIFIGRENGIKLLKSLESIPGPAALKKSFTNLCDEVATATGQTSHDR